MIEPYEGRVYDPCCGSSGMFVQSEAFIRAHNGRIGALSIYGQESNPTTWKLAKMNLAIRGIEANLGGQHADSFHNDLHKTLKTDFLLANPPFNDSDWGGDRLREDVRWKFGTPPTGNANFAWVQHFIHHLAPTGIAGFVLANGSMSSDQSGEGDIRKSITYHAWRGETHGTYADVPGYCKSATLNDIREHGHVLTPGRYVGAPEAEDDDEPFEEKMERLTSELSEQFAESRRLEDEIRKNLKGLGFDV